MKSRDKPVLKFRFEVNQQVPASDQIQLGEGRILDHILGGKDDHFPDFLLDPVAGLLLDKKPSQSLRGDIRGNRGRVAAGTGLRDRVLINVRAVDLDFELLLGIIHALPEEDGNGVGLFPGCAPRHPDSEDVMLRFMLEQLWKDVFLQYRKRFRVPEEARDGDEEFLEEELNLLGMLLEVTGIGIRILYAVDGHPPLDPPVDRALLLE